MWLALQPGTPDDYVLAIGKSYSVTTFAEQAFATIGIALQWQGNWGARLLRKKWTYTD